MQSLRSILTLIVVLSTLLLPFSVLAEEALIKTNYLNVRNGPEESHSKIDQVHKGEIYPILEQQKNWVKIKLENKSGWVSLDYINVQNQLPTVNQLKIAYDQVHLREGPSTDHSITSFAKKGDDFEVLSYNNGWYEVKSEQTRGYIHERIALKEKKSRCTNVKNKTIVIDAGHGGRDVGAIGITGIQEKHLAYKTAELLKEKLILLGANVTLTRLNDEFISLASRTSIANISGGEAFLSLHYNSVADLPDVSGIQSYYFLKDSKEMAQAIQSALIKITGANNRGVHKEDFYVLRQNRNEAVLLELGFISNKESQQLLTTQAYQEKIVAGIINGLNNYFCN
ncbi:N-acetylmuramoyl-L-alanine amidase [Virgibacillus sp. SK37]|uniref:N-acetylmuramoyl-L-alanine amidase n=1 Tax=Virgibacillus sp. SK37 TaxID=403957 RepID=UPI0004D1B0D2|nr:N-acetylmuramoyl-L-alanine amidase [Virgibacillus sp. SK37]AIF43332.1 N-acetylmuramoyl-L-alanine amidase [Virgibacillus sp. SK37]